MSVKPFLLGTASLFAINTAIAQNDSAVLSGFDILVGPTFRLPTEAALYREKPIQFTAEVGKSMLFNNSYEPLIYAALGVDVPFLGKSSHQAFDKYDDVEYKGEIGDKQYAAYTRFDINVAHSNFFPGQQSTIALGLKQYFIKASEVKGLKGITAMGITGTQSCGDNGFLRVELGYEFAAALRRERPNPGEIGESFKKGYGPYMALSFGYKF